MADFTSSSFDEQDLMRFALLGIDDDVLSLARAAHRDSRYEIVAACDVGHRDAELKGECPNATILPDWDLLLESRTADAVLVASADDDARRIEQLRVLAQAGVPMMLAHPVVDDVLAFYELDMIRQDTGVIMMPFIPGRRHPLVTAIADHLRQGSDDESTAIEQVVVERAMRERDKELVTRQFVRDAHLLRATFGEIKRVSALGGEADVANYANLGVQMYGDGNYPLRWSVGPVVEGEGATMTVATKRGPIRLHMPEGRDWTSTGIELKEEEPTDKTIDELRALEQFEAAVNGQPSNCTWADACREVELADAVERSLKRGRAVTIYDEAYTETSVFKGLMGMLGCGLLLLALAIAVVSTIAGALFARLGWNQAAQIAGRWPYVLAAMLIAFLVLQLLRLVLPAEQQSSQGDGANRP